MGDDASRFHQRRLDAGAASELIEHAAAGTAAGLPLDEIFRSLAEDTDNRRLRLVAEKIAVTLRGGGDLRSALRGVENQLPPYLRRTLEASTDLGQTAAVLAALAQHETTRKRLSRQMLTAMLYPAIVLGLLTAIVVGLTTIIVPQLEGIYDDVEESYERVDYRLPDLTLSLIEVARVVPWVVGIAAAVGVGLWFVSFFEGGARLMHWLRTGMPFLGKLWVWNAHHELASILGALVGQRVPLDESLQAAEASLRDRNLARSVRIAAGKCADGAPLSRSLAESMHVDAALPALVSWGEATDSLPDALRQAAATFEEKLDLQVAFLQRIMPSILFIGVVTTVFFFVTGLMLPMIGMMRNLSSWTPTPPPATFEFAIDRLVVSSVSLFIIGVCLRVSLRLLYGARGPAADDSVHLLMRILGWGLIVLPMIVLSIGGANWLSLILLFAVLQALAELVLARREAQRQAVWRIIVGAVGSGRSMVDALRLHQARFSGIVGRAQRRLARDVESGVDWRTAVWSNRRAVPRVAPAFAAMVGADAARARAVIDLDEQRDPVYQHVQRQASQRFVYLWAVALIMGSIIAYVLAVIVPGYEAIFQDFQLTLPAMTTTTISISNAVVNTFGVPLVAVSIVAGLAALAIGLLYLCDIPILRRVTDRLTLFRHRAQAMRLLAAGLEQNKPLDETLQQMSKGQAPHPNKVVRRRLVAARRRVAAGDAWEDALRRSALLSKRDAAVLRTAQSAGNVPWALRLLADRTVRLATFRWAVAQQFAFVAVMLAFGLVVMWFSAAMFVPLVDIVLSLAV